MCRITRTRTTRCPDGVLAWDDLTKSTDATNGQDFARFTFTFTNVANKIELELTTNVFSVTNVTTVTNSSFWARLRGKKIVRTTSISTNTSTATVTNAAPTAVTILSVHPSCGCTTAELPPVPWTIPAGSNGDIKVSVNLAGKSGMLFKTVNVSYRQGQKGSHAAHQHSAAAAGAAHERGRTRPRHRGGEELTGRPFSKATAPVAMLKISKANTASSFLTPSAPSATRRNPAPPWCPTCTISKMPTNEEFWRTWITAGKAGTLMPAFATSQGGPLNDMQIASLAAYLNAHHPANSRRAGNRPSEVRLRKFFRPLCCQP